MSNTDLRTLEAELPVRLGKAKLLGNRVDEQTLNKLQEAINKAKQLRHI
jgi:hypothetical protein